MTAHEYLTYWFDHARSDDRPSEEIIDGFFGYLAACGLDIVMVDGGKAMEILGDKN